MKSLLTKTRLLIIALFLISSSVSKSQNPTLQWVKGMGDVGYDRGNSIAVDALGNVYTTGYFEGTIDFDPGVPVFNLTSVGNRDIFISKLDAAGNFVWAKTIGGSYYEEASSIALDALGNLYITGYFSSTTDFDPNVGVFNLSSTSSSDIFVLKLTTSGNFVWAQGIVGVGPSSSSSYATADAIALDVSGNAYITGFYSGTFDFDPNAGVFNLNSTISSFVGNIDIFVSKLDAAGNFVWAKSMGGASNEAGRSIALDASGNVYTTGYFFTTVDFDPGASVFNLTSAGNEDVFISKLDGAGNFISAKKIGGALSDDGQGITTDASGNIYMTGFFEGTVDFDPNAGIFNMTHNGSGDVFITKLDPTGNLFWAKNVGGALIDRGHAITVDASNNVYTTGYFASTSDFDPNAGIFNLTSVGLDDIFISKLDGSGNFVWTVNMGSVTSETAIAITVDVSNNVYTAGGFEGTCDFDPNAGIFNISPVGITDIFIHKMGQQCIGITTTLTSQTNVLCNGAATGAASVNALGGTGITYSWSPSGGNSASANGLTAGNYTCFVTNSCGTIKTQTVLITQPPALSLTAVANSSTICTGNTSTLTATGSGGSGTIAYNWSGGPTNNVFIVNPTATNVYTIMITDINDCVKSETVSVIVNLSPIITVNSGAICSGQSFTINPSGANTYTYSGGSQVVNPLSNTAYTVTGTNSNGCVGTNLAISNVTVNSNPTITVNSGAICSGQSFTINPSGANTYTYSGGSQVVNPSSNTAYTVTGTSSDGCVGTSLAISNVTVNPNPTITVNSGAICSGQSFTINPSGANSYTYSGGSQVVNPLINTAYTVTGASSDGCVGTSLAISNVTVNPNPTVTVNSGAICPGQVFTITASGANTYSYSSGSPFVSPTVTASYTITGTSVDGCIGVLAAISNVTVSSTPIILVNNGSICSGQSFTIIPTGGSTYSYSSGSAVVSPTSNTSYTVTGSSPAGCVGNGVAICNVTVNTNPTITVNSGSICSGQSFTFNPSGAATYTYSSGSQVVNPLNTATYSVTGSSINGCISSNTAISNVTVNATPVISVNSGTICNGQSFTITPTGANTYSYSGGSSVVNPSSSSSYTVTGTSISGCVSSSFAVSQVTVNANPIIAVNSGAICLGQSFTIIPTGASTYSYSSGSPVVSPSSNTNYTVTGTSSVGCISANVVISSVTVNPNPVIAVNSGSICFGQSFTMMPSGASTYTFSSGSAVVSPTIANSYTVSGTSANGCISSNSAVSNVFINSNPVVTVENGVICVGQNSTSLMATSLNPNLNYTWSGPLIISGSNTPNPSVSAIGVYTVLVSDNTSGCNTTQTLSVSNSSIIAQFTANPNTGPSPLNITFINQSLGATNYFWNLSNGNSTSLSPNNTYFTSGTYTVVLTALNGACTSTASMEIKVLEPIGVIPEVFTPNGDPYNPTFEIKGLDFYTNNSLEVFNRWGNLVYSAKPYKNDWDGNSNTKSSMGNGKLPTGTYFYILSIGDEAKTIYRGYVQLEY